MGEATSPGKREVLLVAPEEEEGEMRDDGRASLRKQGAISFIHVMQSFSHPETFLVHL